jgi:hypothetical protein
VPAERAQREAVAEQPARGGGDHHRAGLGQSLQPGGQVRRLADHRLLLRRTFAEQVADHHQAGGDADAHLELVPGRPPAQGGRSGDGGHVEPPDRGDDVEAGADGALGIVLVGAGKAKINQHAVAHVFGDETVEAANRRRDTLVISADHRAQLFGIEPRRERRRADQIAEHHRQLSARRRRRRGGLHGSSQRRNGSDQPFPVPHRQAKFFEVGLGQLGQDLMVDLVLAEYRRVLFEAKRPQPLDDIHRRLPRQRVAG